MVHAGLLTVTLQHTFLLSSLRPAAKQLKPYSSYLISLLNWYKFVLSSAVKLLLKKKVSNVSSFSFSTGRSSRGVWDNRLLKQALYSCHVMKVCTYRPSPALCALLGSWTADNRIVKASPCKGCSQSIEASRSCCMIVRVRLSAAAGAVLGNCWRSTMYG